MENLLITTICHRNHSVFLELTDLVNKHECYIKYCHLLSLSLDVTVSMQIMGNWSGIAKIETALPPLAKKLGVELVAKRSYPEKIEHYHLPYWIEVIGVNRPEIPYEVSNFLHACDITIQHLEILSETHQKTPLIKLKIQVDLPAEGNIADIRDQFLVFCDELNLDGTLEPRK
jgi:glycine cleavage system transcriptional repressor